MADFVDRPFIWSRLVCKMISDTGALYASPKGYLYQGSAAYTDGQYKVVQNNPLGLVGLMTHPIMVSNAVPTSSYGVAFKLTTPTRGHTAPTTPYRSAVDGYTSGAGTVAVNFSSSSSAIAGERRGWTGAYARDGSCSVALTFSDDVLSIKIRASVVQASPPSTMVSEFVIADTTAYGAYAYTPRPRAVAISPSNCWVFYTHDNGIGNFVYGRKWNGTTFEAAIQLNSESALDFRVIRGDPAGIYVGILVGTTIKVYLMNQDTGSMSAVLATATGVGSGTQSTVQETDIGGNDSFTYKGYNYLVFRLSYYHHIFRHTTGDQSTLTFRVSKNGAAGTGGLGAIEYDPVSDTAYLCTIYAEQMPTSPTPPPDGSVYDVRRPVIRRAFSLLDSTSADFTVVDAFFEMENYQPFLLSSSYMAYDYRTMSYIPSRDGSATKSFVAFRRFIYYTPSVIDIEEVYCRFRSWHDGEALPTTLALTQDATVTFGACVKYAASTDIRPDASVVIVPGRQRKAHWLLNWQYVDSVNEQGELHIRPDLEFVFEPSTTASEETELVWVTDPDVYIEGQITHAIKLEYHWLATGASWFDEFHNLVNAERALFSLPPLKKIGSDSASLNALRIFDVAQIHSGNMAKYRVFAHESAEFPPGWQTIAQRLGACTADNGGENILIFNGYFGTGSELSTLPTPQAAFTEWKNSPPHYANILRDWGPDSDHVYSSLGVAWGDVPTTLEPTAYEMCSIYFTNNFLVLVEEEVETYFAYRWAVNALDIAFFSNSWNEAYYTKARADILVPYGIGIGQDLLVENGQLVTQEVDVAFGYSVSADLQVPYSLLSVVAKTQLDSVWDISRIPVSTVLDVPYAVSVAVGLEALYGDTAAISADVELPYSALIPAAGDLVAELVLSSSVATQVDAPYDMLTGTPIATDLVGYYNIDIVSTTEAAGGVRILYGGVWRPLDDAILTSDADSPGFVLEASVTDAAAMDVLLLGTPVTVDFVGTQYSLLVSSVSRQLTPKSPAPTVKLRALSPVFFKGSPYSENVTFAPAEARLMSLLIQDLLGEPVAWYVVDWVVPYGRAQSYGQSALETAQNMLRSIGATLLSLPDGSLEARYIYPVPLDKTGTVAPDISLVQEDGVFSMDMSVEFSKGYNKFRIRDSEGGYGDRIDWDEETQIATVSIFPWRTTWSFACTTPSVQIEALGEVAEEIEEEVSFTNGEATTSKGVVALLDIQWISTPLGSIAFEPYSTRLSAPTDVSYGYGLVKLRYQTKQFKFKVTAVGLDSSQLIILEN